MQDGRVGGATKRLVPSKGWHGLSSLGGGTSTDSTDAIRGGRGLQIESVRDHLRTAAVTGLSLVTRSISKAEGHSSCGSGTLGYGVEDRTRLRGISSTCRTP